jgi:sulfite reductase (NADPH) hemoprotein beta-component
MSILEIDRSVDLSQPVSMLHDNEQLKFASNYLRGNIAKGIQETLTRAMPGLDPLLLKFHGIYQQDNRDNRSARVRRKLEPDYQFMVRLRIPGGSLSTKQWQALSLVAERYAGEAFRITSRQTIQLHGVRKPQLKACMQAVKALGLDTVAACGDDSRGIVCGVNPALSAVHDKVLQIAQQTSKRLIPKTSAYDEIWHDRPSAANVEEEPVYGPLYLPRKFKVGFTIPPRNDVDIFAQDVGFIAITSGDALLGFNLCVGGGMGQLDTREDSYPRIAEVVGFVEADEATDVAETIMGIQRDFGDRRDRHRARFKYTLDRLGMPWFLETLAARRGKPLASAKPYNFISSGDRFGWQQGTNGLWYGCLHIASGRIKGAIRDRLDGFFQQFGGDIRFTANQNLVLSNVMSAELAQINWRLDDLGLAEFMHPDLQAEHSLTCVGFPTCGLAMAESERFMPGFVTAFNELKAAHGLQHLPIKLRVTGCPNGCARPYLAEIALTGRAPGIYNLYLGGGFHGQRLNQLYSKNLSAEKILAVLDELFERYTQDSTAGEAFGDFLCRCVLPQAASAQLLPLHTLIDSKPQEP